MINIYNNDNDNNDNNDNNNNNDNNQLANIDNMFNFKLDKYVPIVFHNLRGYDGHLILREAYKINPDWRYQIIPQNHQKFMSLKIGTMQFIDSLLFMNESLDTLVKNLKGKDNDINNLIHTKMHFNENTSLMSRKGVYPYDYVNNDDVFKL